MERPPEILLGEDDDEDAELALAALAAVGLDKSVRRARDGEEVLEFVNGEGRHADRKGGPAPKVVLLDLKMPRLTGLEVLERLKGSPKTRGIPVVIMSSSFDRTDVQRAYALGANSYVVKPVAFEQYSETLGRVAVYWMKVNLCSHLR